MPLKPQSEPPKVKERKKKWSSKSKTGCLTCRKRRVKCDENRPVCLRCLRGNHACHFYYPPPVHPTGSDKSQRIGNSPPALLQFNSSFWCFDMVTILPLIQPDNHGGPEFGIPKWNMAIFSHAQRFCAYLYHIPCRAGHDQALDSAVKCVASALRWRYTVAATKGDLIPPRKLLVYYGEALRDLQVAVNDPIQSLSAETLGASALLFLFQALIKNKDDAAAYHALGSARLVQHRGPSRFVTEFDKTLLMTQIPIMLVNAVYAGEQHFLDSEEWRAAMMTCVIEKSTILDRWGPHIVLMTRASQVSGLIGATVNFIAAGEQNYDPLTHLLLLSRLRQCRESLREWYVSIGKEISDYVDQYKGLERAARSDPAVLSVRLDVLSTYHLLVMLCNRFYGALGGEGRRRLEDESRTFAMRMKGSSEQNVCEKRVFAYDMQVPRRVEGCIVAGLGGATSILATTEEWSAAMGDYGDDDNGVLQETMVSPSILFRWLDLMQIASWPVPSPPMP